MVTLYHRVVLATSLMVVFCSASSNPCLANHFNGGNFRMGGMRTGGLRTYQMNSLGVRRVPVLRTNMGSMRPGYGWRGATLQNNSWSQNHPRQAEVFGRDNNLGHDIQADRGQLGGNYQKLASEDRSIRQQDIADAKANGGYITPQQQQQLNQEENQLRTQIGQDYTGHGSF